MIRDLNKIFEIWKDKVGSKRTPNPKSAEHQYKLREILNKFNWDEEVINELIYNLSEEKNYVDNSKNQALGRVGLPYGSAGTPPEKEEPKDDEKEPKKEKPSYEPDFENDSEEEIAEKLGGGDFEETSPERAEEDLTENRKGALSRKRVGKGGSTTTQREELATISREIGLKHPNDDVEEHKRKVLQYIRELYKDNPEDAERIIKQIDKPQKAKNLINTTLSGLSAAKLLRDSKNGFDMAPEQTKPYPLNVTFTGEGTQTIQNVLITKLKKCKELENPQERADCVEHYSTELKAFQKMATSSTGKEGDGDTAMVYIDSKGRVKIVYSSNKQSLSDAFSNATVKSASEVIKESEVKGANAEALAIQVEDSVADAVEFNKTYTTRNRKLIDENREELNKAPLTKVATKALTGRGIYEPSTDKYINKARQSPAIKDCLESKGYDINNDDHVVECAFDVTGKPPADEINDSQKQAANKLVMKITRATSKVREIMQRLIDKGMSKEEAAEKAATLNGGVGGGGLAAQECLDIYNNKALEKLEKSKHDRDEAISESHEQVHTRLLELDRKYYTDPKPKGMGLSDDEARAKLGKEAGPHERTMNKAFMKRMHWDRYANGEDDGKKIIEIGDKTYTTKHFSECLGKLSGWEPDRKGKLSDHLEKQMRIKPGTQKLVFVTGKGEEIELGNDTWRQAGDLSKIAGSLGKDMEQCLEGKS